MILRPTTTSDIRIVADNLREADRRELWASQPGKAHNQIVCESVMGSVILQTIADGEAPVGIWGVQPLPDHTAYGSIWMVGTAGLETIALSFLRACRPAIAQAHERFPHLLCAAHKDNTLHLTWLRWLGFTPMVGMTMPEFIPHFRNV